jgi:AbrB family looped-hinge helix DNA binding protein
MATAPDTAKNTRLLSELLAAQHHLLLRQARKHAQLEADAEEALQSACLLFIDRYQHRYEPLPWLLTTIKREAWRLARRSSRRREHPLAAAPCADGRGTVDLTDACPDESAERADLVEANDLRRRRIEALGRLKPDERTAAPPRPRLQLRRDRGTAGLDLHEGESLRCRGSRFSEGAGFERLDRQCYSLHMPKKVNSKNRRTRHRDQTRVSSKHQVTIPASAFRNAGLRPGDTLRVAAARSGEIVLTRIEELADRYSGALDTGGALRARVDGLRDEWR